MGDRDRSQAAALADRSHYLVVDQRLAVPEDVALVRGNEERSP